MFNVLYSILGTFLWVFFMSLLISSNVYDKKPLTLLSCLEKDLDSELSWRVFITGRALSIIQLIVVWTLYKSAMNFVQSKSCNKNPPRIFGLFQRNIVTLNQIVMYYTFQSIYQFSKKLLIFLMSGQMKSLKNLHLICDLVSTLIVPLLLQVFLALNLYEKIPNLYSEPMIKEPQKPRMPLITPRRDFEVANFAPRQNSRILYVNEVTRYKSDPAPVTSFRKSKTIFVKSGNNSDL